MRRFLKPLYILPFLLIMLFNVAILIFITRSKVPPSELRPSMRKHKTNTVVISGKVSFKNYKKGPIVVMASSTLQNGMYLRPDIAVTTIPMPGDFSLAVPKNIGTIYLKALSAPMAFRDQQSGKEDNIGYPIGEYSFGVYKSNPIEIKALGIGDVDIEIDNTISPIMTANKNPTVTISGTVTFDEYKDGRIIVMANDREFTEEGMRSIAITSLSSPGDYSLDVPKDIGDVYIGAGVVSSKRDGIYTGSRMSFFNFYVLNPVKIGSSDIKAVNIVLDSLSPLMESYKGPTVTVSGRINFDEYKGGQIMVMANEKGFMQGDNSYISTIKLSLPGEYSIRVPRDAGKMYIGAVVPIYKLGESTKVMMSKPIPYSGNPLKIGSSDIKYVDIDVTTFQPPPLTATAHKGHTVTISGEVTFKQYKRGQLIVIANDKDFREYDARTISGKVLSSPGKYSFEIPEDIGKVYIGVIALISKGGFVEPTEQMSEPISYLNNPISIASSDIDDIDIDINELNAPPDLMTAYEGPTVTIRGAVEFDKFSEGEIFIEVLKDSAKNRRITGAKISKEGKFSLEVPVSIGAVYIQAIYARNDFRDPDIVIPYTKNPIYIKNSDINDVVININID